MRAFADNDANGHVATIARRELLLRWTIRLACVALLVAVACGAVRGYRAWREQHLTAQVRSFVERGDFGNAVLVARRLLVLNADNLAACDAMAEMAEAAAHPEALRWHQKLLQLQPGDTGRQLEFARAALRFGQLELAQQLLTTLPEAARSSVRFHEIAGSAALAQGNLEVAESHFLAAQQLEPAKPQLALNLAMLHITSRDEQVASAARATLAQFAHLAAEPPLRDAALRALAAEALARRENEEAQRWTAPLCAAPDAPFSDLLLHYQAVAGSDAAPAALAALQNKAAASLPHAAELITWLNRRGMAAHAAEWAATLPPQIAQQHPVPLAIAETFSFREDWEGLREFVGQKHWGAYEALRLAVESHALQRLGAAGTASLPAQNAWRAAIKAADRRPEQLAAIAQLAEGWGYHAQAEEAWWAIAQTQDNARTALGALQRIYRQRQDSRGLFRVAKRALELNPGDLIAANNCASLGLLLNADNSSRRLAARLHREHPQNRAFTATYAFALHTEGKTAEALQLLESLEAEVLHHPAVAAYYFILLIESDQLERARPFLAYAKRATLLPEEQQLLAAATRKLLASETAAVPRTAAE